MIFKILGSAPGTKDLPQDLYEEAGDGSVTCSRTYRALYADWLPRAPKRGSAHPLFPDLKLETRTARQLEAPFLCDVTLGYKQPAPAPEDVDPEDEENPQGTPPETGATLPADEFEENNSQVEIPIQQHPNWEDTFKEHWDFTRGAWKETAPDYLQGVTSYIVGSVLETHTQYFWGRPPSVKDLVGKHSGGWLVVSGARRRSGIYWARSISRLYSTKGWPTQIYGAES